MKKLLLFLTLSLTIAMSAFAAAPKGQHAEFMDVPITGKISSFASMMPKLGYTYDAETTALLSDGKRSFEGMYKGYYADVWLCSDPKTNLMYGVCVFIDFLDYDDAVDAGLDIAMELMEDIDAIYDEDSSSEDEIDFEIYNVAGDHVGSVSISVIEADDDDSASLMIYFFDEINFNKYNKNK